MARRAAGSRVAAKASVFIVDDHAVVRDGLSNLINLQDDMRVCGEAADVDAAVRTLWASAPDIAIVDICLGAGNGLSLIRDIRAKGWPTVLVLSMYDDAAYVRRAFEAGAKGYVAKQEKATVVLEAIRKIVRGETYLSQSLASGVVPSLVSAGAGSGSPVDVLSAREFEVFHLIGQGMTPRQIAEALHRSAKTIQSHRERIRRKLGLRSSTEVVRVAAVYVGAPGRR